MICNFHVPPSVNIPRILRRQTFLLRVCTGFLCGVVAAVAQGITDYKDEEVVTLEDFQVSAALLQDSYIATETTSATRTKDKIIDTPFSVQVLSEDFVNDFHLYSGDDLFAYVASATANTGRDGEMRVRGFRPLSTRDGFQHAMQSAPANTLSTEVIRGPQSTLYGRATPGGIVNKIARRPKFKPSITLSGSYGTDSYYRISANATGPVAPSITGNKLFYYAYYEKMHQERPEDYVEQTREYFGLTLLYRFRSSTSLMLTLEYQPQYDHESSGGAIFRPADGSPYIRNWTDIGTFSLYGPDAYRDATFLGFNALFEHRINSVWAMRAALQTYSKDTYRQRWSSPTYFYESNQTFSERYPFKQNQEEECVAGQVDLLAQFKTRAVTPITHRILFAADASRYTRDNVEKRTYSYDSDIPAASIYLKINDRSNYIFYDYGLLSNSTADRYITKTAYGALASYRASMLGGKIAFMGSLRYDRFEDDLNDRRDRQQGENNSDRFTYSTGLNYHIWGDKMLVYGSISTGFQSAETIDRGMVRLIEPANSFGYEIGLKGANPDGDFAYTLSFYKIRLENVHMRNPGYTDNIDRGTKLVPEFLLGNIDEAVGVELSGVYQPTKSLTLMVTGGYTDSNVVSSNETRAIGRPLEMVSKWTGSAVARYVVREGTLKGFGVGMGATYRSSYIGDYATDTTLEMERPSLFLLEGMARYEWRTGSFKHRVTLNIKNLLDKTYYYYNGRPQFGREGRITYKVDF